MKIITYYILLGFVYLLSMLPLKVLYWISNVIRFFFVKVFGYRRQVVDINLSRAFPELKYGEIRKISKEFHRNLIDTFIEQMWALSRSAKAIGKRVSIDDESVRILNKSLAINGRVILIMGHQGNWELNGALHSFKGDTESFDFTGEELHPVYQKVHSEISNRLMKRLRTSHGITKLIESKETVRFLSEHKEERGVYLLISDQAPARTGLKYATTFLSQKTYLIHGAEAIAKKMDIPVLFLGMDRIARGRYHINIEVISDNPKESENGYITGEFFRRLERSIIANKSNWLWSHKRWKRSPETDEKITIV